MMVKLDPVEKLSMELARLVEEERDAQERLDTIRAERAQVRAQLRLATGSGKSPPQRISTKSVVSSKPTPGKRHEKPPSDAERVKQYVMEAGDKLLLTNDIAKELGIRAGSVSTYLSRMTGKLVERVPGTQRGKFRLIKRTT